MTCTSLAAPRVLMPIGSCSSCLTWAKGKIPAITEASKFTAAQSFPRTGNGLFDVPNSRQTVCYVINDWTFSSRTDNTGSGVGRPTKLTVFKGRPILFTWPTTTQLETAPAVLQRLSSMAGRWHQDEQWRRDAPDRRHGGQPRCSSRWPLARSRWRPVTARPTRRRSGKWPRPAAG